MTLLPLALSLLVPGAHATDDCPDLWALDLLRADFLWARIDERGINAAPLALLGASFEVEHSDLGGRITEAVHLVSPDSAVGVTEGPFSDRAMAMAGVVAAADNALGRTGVAPEGRLTAYQVADLAGDIKLTAYVEGLERVAAGADAAQRVALSAVESASSPQALVEAVGALGDADVLLVVPAGDCDGCPSPSLDDEPVYPAATVAAHVLTVAATDRDDTLLPTSRRSPTRVDLAAPGGSICTLGASATGATTTVSSTAAAAAFVAGGAQLVRTVYPDLTAPEVATLFRQTAVAVEGLEDAVRSGGRLDLERLFLAAIPGVPALEAEAGALSITVDNPGADGELTLFIQHHDEARIASVLEPDGFTVTPIAPGDSVPQANGQDGPSSQVGSLVTGPLPEAGAVTVRLEVTGSAAGLATVRGGASSAGAAWFPTPVQGETVDSEGNPAESIEMVPAASGGADTGEAPARMPDEGCGCSTGNSTAPWAGIALVLGLVGWRRRSPATPGDAAP